MRLGGWILRWSLALALAAVSATSVRARSFPYSPDVTLDAQQTWGASMQGYAVKGCLPTAGAGAAVQVPPCRAYALDTTDPARLIGFEEETARSLTLTAGDGIYWVTGRALPWQEPAGWTCPAGVHYCWQKSAPSAEAASGPDTPLPAGLVLLARVELASGLVTSLGDLRSDTPIRGAPLNARAPLWGVVADCVTDTQPQLQPAINAGLWQKRAIYLPQGCYATMPLWFNYDAANNPSAPNLVREHGRIRLFGDNPLGFANLTNNDRRNGTILLGLSPTANAFNITHTTTDLVQITLTDLTLIANTTGWVMHWNNAVQNANMARVTVHQQSTTTTGGGILLDNSFVVRWEDVLVRGTNAGVGLWVRHSATPGGLNTFYNLNVREFATCWRLGDTQPPGTSTDKGLTNSLFIGSQVGECDTNVYVGTGVSSAVFLDVHNEMSRDFGYFFTGGAGILTVQGGAVGCVNQVLPQNACIRIGDSTVPLAAGAATTITIQGVGFGFVRTRGVDIQNTTGIKTIVLGANSFAGQGETAQAIRCEGSPTFGRGLVLLPQTFSGFTANPIAGCNGATAVFEQQFSRFGQVVLGSQSATVVTAAATITLPCDGNLVLIKGPGTVSRIEPTLACGVAALPGTVITLELELGASAVTLAHGTDNLRLDGHADKVLSSAADSCALRWSAGNTWVSQGCKTP